MPVTKVVNILRTAAASVLWEMIAAATDAIMTLRKLYAGPEIIPRNACSANMRTNAALPRTESLSGKLKLVTTENVQTLVMKKAQTAHVQELPQATHAVKMLLPASTVRPIVPIVLTITVKRAFYTNAFTENAICQTHSGENAALPTSRRHASPEQPAVQMRVIMKKPEKYAKNMTGKSALVVNIPASAII